MTMTSKRSFLDSILSYFEKESNLVSPVSSERYRLSGKSIRIPYQGHPFVVEMGKQRLHLYPDLGLDDAVSQTPFDFILFDPDRYAVGISSFLRLSPGQKLVIDYRSENQKYLFSHPREVRRRHLQINHEGDGLSFKDPISELGTYVSLITDEGQQSWIQERRRRALEEVVAAYGGPIEPLAEAEALDTLKKVNRVLRQESFRHRDTFGNPGGVVNLPAHLTPIIVGDLHGQVNNLLKLLSENAFMESLERGTAALILLGDAVHEEEEALLEKMDDSLLIMDLIFKLKLRFPSQVFFLLGNHDSFSMDVMKGGVPQGLLWEKYVLRQRGEAYRDEMALFYQSSPVIVVGEDFIACHAGPPQKKVSLEKLVDARQFPELVHELTWNRVQTRRYPAGYSRADVRRFRKALGFEEDVAMIVGHYPLSEDQTVWLDVRNIEGHHIVFSALPDKIGVFTRIEGELTPIVYPDERLLPWLNTYAAQQRLR